MWWNFGGKPSVTDNRLKVCYLIYSHLCTMTFYKVFHDIVIAHTTLIRLIGFIVQRIYIQSFACCFQTCRPKYLHLTSDCLWKGNLQLTPRIASRTKVRVAFCRRGEGGKSGLFAVGRSVNQPWLGSNRATVFFSTQTFVLEFQCIQDSCWLRWKINLINMWESNKKKKWL